MIKVGRVCIFTSDELTVGQAKIFMLEIAEGLYIPKETYCNDIYAAADLKVYDYALPQSWFDDYIKRHGRAPRGVWSYDEFPAMGAFVSLEDCFTKIAEKAIAGIEPGVSALQAQDPTTRRIAS